MLFVENKYLNFFHTWLHRSDFSMLQTNAVTLVPICWLKNNSKDWCKITSPFWHSLMISNFFFLQTRIKCYFSGLCSIKTCILGIKKGWGGGNICPPSVSVVFLLSALLSSYQEAGVCNFTFLGWFKFLEKVLGHSQEKY